MPLARHILACHSGHRSAPKQTRLRQPQTSSRMLLKTRNRAKESPARKLSRTPAWASRIFDPPGCHAIQLVTSYTCHPKLLQTLSLPSAVAIPLASIADRESERKREGQASAAEHVPFRLSRSTHHPVCCVWPPHPLAQLRRRPAQFWTLQK
eukprot:1402387-Rhodomonas_salina.1